MTVTVSIPAGFKHHAAIYTSSKPYGSPDGSRLRHTIVMPYASEFVSCFVRNRDDVLCVMGSSERPPIIMIGNGTYEEKDSWDDLCYRAALYRVPLDTLLTDRPLKVACDVWTPSGPYSRGKDAITIHAVQVLGDLTKSAILDEKIAEIKGWFKE